jgi:hypothetical protein
MDNSYQMSDDKHKKELDGKLISLKEDYEVKYWCKALNCTEQELRAAVAAVGDSAKKVREYLGQ